MNLFVNFRDASRKNIFVSYDDSRKSVLINVQGAENKQVYSIEILGVASEKVIKENYIFTNLIMTRMSDNYLLFEPFDEKLLRFGVSENADSIICIILPTSNKDLYIKEENTSMNQISPIFDLKCLIGVDTKRLYKIGIYIFEYKPSMVVSIDIGLSNKKLEDVISGKFVNVGYSLSRAMIFRYPYYEWRCRRIRKKVLETHKDAYIKYTKLARLDSYKPTEVEEGSECNG